MTITLPQSKAALSKNELFARVKGPAQGEKADAEGKLWEITVVAAGPSLSGDVYPAEVLKAALPHFKGLPIYSFKFGDTEGGKEGAGNHHLPEGVTAEKARRLTSNQIGEVVEVWWNEEEQSVDGFAAIDDSALRDKFKNAHDRKAIGVSAEQDIYGFSIWAEALKAGADGKEVTKIVRGNSLDLVTRPAAGGRFKRLVAGLEPEENDMADLTELTALVTGLKKELEDVKQGLTTQREMDPIATLQQWLEGLQGEEKASAIQRISAMLTSLGAGGTMAGAPPSREEFHKLTAELAAVTEEKDVKKQRARLATLLESVQGKAEPEDPRDAELRQLRESLRRSAIRRELSTLKLERDGKEVKLHSPETVLRLADTTGVTVVDDKVEGLKEAVDKLLAEQPFLAQAVEEPQPDDPLKVVARAAAEAAIKAGKSPEDAQKAAVAAVAAATKASAATPPPAAPASRQPAAAKASAPSADEIAAKAIELANAQTVTAGVATGTGDAEVLGQAVSIRESIDANGGAIPEHLKRRISSLQMRMTQEGDIDAALEYQNIRKAILKLA